MLTRFSSDRVMEGADSRALADPDELLVLDFDVRGAVFVIPIDAPVPSELADIVIPTGTLYERIKPITAQPDKEFALVPVSGAELIALNNVWRVFQEAKKVFALFDLPGAKYDVTFTQATKVLGLHRADWSSMASALSKRVRVVQRTADKEPWRLAKRADPTTSPDGDDLPGPSDDVRGTQLLAPLDDDGDGV